MRTTRAREGPTSGEERRSWISLVWIAMIVSPRMLCRRERLSAMLGIYRGRRGKR